MNCQRFRGRTATAFLEWMTPSDLRTLAPYTSILSLVLNDKGGILDDAILTKHSDETFYMVSNAGQRDTVVKWFKDKLKQWNSSERGKVGPVELELMDGWGLLALQGTRTPTPALRSSPPLPPGFLSFRCHVVSFTQ